MKHANTYSGPLHGDENSINKEEILGFPARFLFDLPLNTSLTLRVPGFTEDVVLTTRVLEPPRRSSKQIWFDREEVRALISATESERAWLNDLRVWCWMKREDPGFLLDLEIALSGAQPSKDRNWDVGRILKRLGLDLVLVTVAHAAVAEDGAVAKAA